MRANAAPLTAPMLPSDTTEPAASPARALDLFAVFLSGLCLVHCLALPVLAAFIPFFGAELFANERMHLWLLVAVLPTSLFALGFGFRWHRHRGVVAMGVLALIPIIVAALGRNFGNMTEFGDRLLTVSGGVVLAFAHLRNYHLLHALRHAAHHRQPSAATATEGAKP
jgi:hypothetical protein